MIQELLDFVEKHPASVGALIAVVPLFPKGRRLISRAWGWLRGEPSRKQLMDKLDAVLGQLTNIEKQVNYNGGKSVKDMLFLLFRYREHDFWRIGIPAFEMDENGQMVLVSEAACKLFGVSSPDSLKRRSWLRFVSHIGTEGNGVVDDLLAAYADTVKFNSEFLIQFHITQHNGCSRGHWEMRGSPISHENASAKVYSCHLSPVDDVARAASKEVHHGCPLACRSMAGAA